MNSDEIRKRMQEVADLVASDVSSVRTGAAKPGIVAELQIAVYQGQQRLKVSELGTVSASDSQTIVIDPWDKSIIGEIRKGIEASNLGFSPNIDGEIIRISIPPLTSEDREKYAKLLRRKIESGKVMIRQIRGDAMRDIKKAFGDKELSEDEKFNEEKKLQGITDDLVGKIEEIGQAKEKELLQM